LTLPDDFSERVMFSAKSPGGFSARRDLKRGFVFSHRPAVRRNAAGKSKVLKEKRPRGQRVLNGPSGPRAGGRASLASWWVAEKAFSENAFPENGI
jgi:hypothetical protein